MHPRRSHLEVCEGHKLEKRQQDDQRMPNLKAYSEEVYEKGEVESYHQLTPEGVRGIRELASNQYGD